jgi:hydroxymethylglutaryl-CoA reductase
VHGWTLAPKASSFRGFGTKSCFLADAVMSHERTSRVPGFYRLPVAERRARLAELLGLPAQALAALDGGLDLGTADHMVENVVGTYALPMGLALNFRVNGEDVLVPMVVEEASVIAAASNAARMVRASSERGFETRSDDPIMIAQVQLLGVADPDAAAQRIDDAEDELLVRARETLPRLCQRGGGPVGVEARVLSRPRDPDGGMVVVHLHVDCRDAMGANLVNTLAESIAGRLAELAGPGARPGLRILSNLADRRLVQVSAQVSFSALEEADAPGTGRDIALAIASASRFAELDPYRAATHNKGIMNGVDAVLLATGNDWRSIEAGAHAYAAADGGYAPLATWRVEGDHLVGRLTMPMAVGTVGGAQQVHGGARLALEILGAEGASDLGGVVGAAGLASNLAALRALATDGIQRGHMALHARVVARSIGAEGDLLERVAAEIAAAGDVKPERARQVLARLLAAESDATGDAPSAHLDPSSYPEVPK